MNMATNTVAKIAVSFKLANGRTVTLREGDIVKGLTYRNGNDTNTVDGAVRVINATTKAASSTHYCLPEPYLSGLVNVTSIVVDMSEEFDAELQQISIGSIVDIEEVLVNEGAIKIGADSHYIQLADIINGAEEDTVIELLAGTYEADLNINKSIKIISEDGAILKGNITINGQSLTKSTKNNKVSVVLDGLFLTGDSKITVNNVSEFVMRNCVYTKHNFESKTNPIIINATDETPVKVNIDNNVFGKENDNCYNIIEVYGYLKNDSTFNNNRFESYCCTHNQISLYNVADNALIEINDNYCANSKNMVRLGFKGNPSNVIVEMNDNTYVETDTVNPDYAGLFLVQPYGTKTESLEGVRIEVNETSKPAGQLCYLYAGSNDMQFNDNNKPTIVVDNKVMVPVIITQ